MNEKQPTILLVLDDEATVCRSLRRILDRSFDEVCTAETPADAEVVLESRPVTHLLCDQLLGPGQQLGYDLATRWRASYPTIRRVVLLTGTDISGIHESTAIDCVLPKTTEIDEIAHALGIS